MDIEKLKQKILDLAIRGKLVPQDPNDEPASVLIEKIRTEKEALIKQGKIKRDKNESYIFKGDDNSYYEKVNGETKKINVPFDIPTTWEWVRLCSLGQVIGGGTPSTEIKAYWDKGTISWITPADMGEHRTKYISFTQRKISELGLSQSSATLMPPNSIVLSSRAPIGYLGITKISLCTNQGCKSVVPYLQESVEYLYYAIMMAIPNIKERASGTTFKEISGKGFGQTLIPLPPLCEQNRIADLLIQTENKFTIIQSSYNDISRRIEILKYKILDSFFGEDSRYKSYYENEQKLGEILKYEQPAKYIVNSTNYSDDFATPVLTPGKTFILGYTNEKEGIYHVNGEKVIIFDDFTTASRLVDFNFKVKSSAMKILTISNQELFDVEYMYLLLQTIHVNNNTHKRYWISDFATRKVKIHTIQEQTLIVKEIKRLYSIIEKVVG